MSHCTAREKRTSQSNAQLRAFSVAGPAAWNSLPDYLRDPLRSFDSFCRDLKTFLFSLYQRTQRIGGFAIMRYINLLLITDSFICSTNERRWSPAV